MRSKNTSVRRLIAVLALIASVTLGLSTPINANAQDQKKKDSDKVDISDLENKYWAPKDTDFSVVQNRTYSKAKRVFLSAHYGPVINDQFNDGNAMSASINYFFDERYGLQLDYLKTEMSFNDATKALEEYGGGVTPNFNQIQGGYYLGFNWVPFYAKMSVLGKKITYFDMAFTPLIGMTEFEQQNRTANRTDSSLTYGFNVTQFFFLSNHLAIRADLKSLWYTEEVISWQTGAKVQDKSSQKTIFTMGLTYYF